MSDREQPAAEVQVSVVLPAYNEADHLDGAVDDVTGLLADLGVHGEIVIVENGSTDETAAIAAGLAATRSEVRAMSLPRADYGAALRAGFEHARGAIVVNFDVDFYDGAFLRESLHHLDAHADTALVIGTKRGAGALDRRPWPRRAVTAAFSWALRVGFGLGVSDTHGMKALRRVALVEVVGRCVSTTDLFDSEMVIRAERVGLGIVEIPVTVEERRPARTSIVRRGVRTVWGLAVLRRRLRR